MNTLSQLKQTFQTEKKIEIQNGLIYGDGVEWTVNPEDKYTIEEALKWKEENGGDVTVLMVGSIIWGVEKRMFVCKDHVTQGLKLISTPHVKKIKDDNSYPCRFCNEKADFKLFHFISLSRNDINASSERVERSV